MVSNTNKQSQYWSKQDTASSASGPTIFGGTGGDTDYSEAAIASAPDGTLYAVWIVQNVSISMKRKLVNHDWEPTRAIYKTGSGMAYIDIAVSSSGQVFVVWNQNYLYRYVRSADGGNTWSKPGAVSSKTPYKPIFIAAGGNDIVVAAFGSNDRHVYASVWNGAAFDTFNLTPFQRSGDFFAFAKPAVAPNGKIYVAFQNVNEALYYTERQPDGSWPVSRLACGGVYGPPGLAVDAQNNLHVTWSGDKTGRWELYYAFKPANGDWQERITAAGIKDKIISDVDAAATIGARVYDHAVFETFDGSGGAAIRYQQFSSDSSVLAATPVLDGGASLSRNSIVTVSFKDVLGSPDGVRYHWDAAPTDTDAWLPFAGPLSIPGPPNVVPETCGAHILYTQVKKGTLIQAAPSYASEIFDTGVQAEVSALNPNMAYLPSNSALRLADIATQGASDGDPHYTRQRQFFLQINGVADCADLKQFVVAGGTPGPISANKYDGRLALPGGAAPGDKSFDVQVSDQIGNQKTWPFTLTYDPANTDTTGALTNTAGLPVLAPGGSFQADDANSIIRSLSFQGISVTDNLYGQREQLDPGKQFWGVWIANTTSPTATVDDPGLRWFPVRVPQPGSTFTVTWDLFTGLGYTTDLRNKPGDYFVYVRFLDGAGNPSHDALKATVTLLPNYTLATRWLPLIRK
jgi:hypothetical protein